MAKHDLTAEQARAVISYDPITGIFLWISGIRKGKEAGYRRPDGYVDIRIGDYLYRSHRLAWLLVTGKWPAVWIDHIDRDPTNCQWNNLREATISQNHQNQKVRKDSKVGLRGIEHHESGLFRARLVINGKRIQLGYFKTKEEAFMARLEGERKHFTHSTVFHTQSAYPDAYVLPGAIESDALECSQILPPSEIP